MIRNNIKGNNLNITQIMQNAKVQKGIVFDKILVNTYTRCMSLMDYETSNIVLNVDNVLNYNSTNDNYISIDPEQYKFTSVPSFSEKENEILRLFYGVFYN
jgi:hypothetical protein